MAIKLTKNEQKVQKDRLKQYQRYLPTLQLKKQQLQAVITKTKADLDQKEVERAQMIGDLDDWVAVFADLQRHRLRCGRLSSVGGHCYYKTPRDRTSGCSGINTAQTGSASGKRVTLYFPACQPV